MNKTQIENLPTVAVLGLGYVGLTLSTVLAKVGFQVIGVDRNKSLVSELKRGRPHFFEVGLEQSLADISKLSHAPLYQVGLPEPCADIYVVTVGTPIRKPSREPDLDYVRSACMEVAKVLQRGNMVILRSTVPVGTTRNLAISALEEVSGLKAGTDFDVAFCPERTVEGKALRELQELPQVIGGLNRKSLERARALFGVVTPTTLDLGSLEAAEMLKIMDNTYRDLSFAYSNKMATLCNEIGLDVSSIIRAANQGYNRNNIPVPSPGVGGACLSKDPYILASVCDQFHIDPTLFLEGRKINEGMPFVVRSQITNELAKLDRNLEDARILILGFAFKGKPETSDMRDSPTLDLVEMLQDGGAELFGHDPLVAEKEIEELGVKFVDIHQGFSNADAVVVMIDHSSYTNLDIPVLVKNRTAPLILIDGWSLYPSNLMNAQKNIVHRTL